MIKYKIYQLRVYLATKLFAWGNAMHPDTGGITSALSKMNIEIAALSLFVSKDKPQKVLELLND